MDKIVFLLTAFIWKAGIGGVSSNVDALAESRQNEAFERSAKLENLCLIEGD